MGNAKDLARYEALAEKAYGEMYDAAPHNVKDFYEDASLYLNHAIIVARELGLTEEMERLRKRSDHIDAVYNSQFRHVGR